MKRVGAIGFLLFKVAVTALFVYIANRSLRQAELSLVLSRTKVLPVAGVALLGILGIAIHTHRWRLVLHARMREVTFAKALKTFLWGNALAFVTPARIGELARGIELAPEKKASTAISVGVDKIFIVGATLLCGSITALILPVKSGLTGITVIFPWLQAGSAALFLAAIAVRPGLNRSTGSETAGLGKVVRWWSGFPKVQHSLGRRLLLWSIAAQVVLVIQTAIALEMFGKIGFFQGMHVGALSYSFMVFFPFSIANMGVREYAFSLFASRFNLAPSGELAAICLGASAAIMIVNMLLPALIGVVWELLAGQKPGGDNAQGQ